MPCCLRCCLRSLSSEARQLLSQRQSATSWIHQRAPSQNCGHRFVLLFQPRPQSKRGLPPIRRPIERPLSSNPLSKGCPVALQHHPADQNRMNLKKLFRTALRYPYREPAVYSKSLPRIPNVFSGTYPGSSLLRHVRSSDPIHPWHSLPRLPIARGSVLHRQGYTDACAAQDPPVSVHCLSSYCRNGRPTSGYRARCFLRGRRCVPLPRCALIRNTRRSLDLPAAVHSPCIARPYLSRSDEL